MPSLSYFGAREDRQLLGAVRDLSTRGEAQVFLKALEGLPLDDRELAIFRERTGRSDYAPPPGGYPEALLLAARQTGKTEVGVDVAAVEAVRAALDPQRRGARVVLVAQDTRSATRTLYARLCDLFDRIPALRRLVVRRLVDEVALLNDVRVGVYPCRPSAVRGLSADLVVLDEVAFFFSSDARAVDREMLTAVRPALLARRGRLLLLSSPYLPSGAVFDVDRRHFGKDGSETLVFRAPHAFNPTLDAQALARIREEDPEAARSELDAEFRAGLSLLLDADAIDAVVDRGVRERAPVPGTTYHAGADLSGGRKDRAALAIAHIADGRIVQDVSRCWPAPHDPAQVVAEQAALLKAYGPREVYADAYAAEFAVSAYREHGITLKAVGKDRSALYLGLVAPISAQQLLVLEHKQLLAELRGLERRAGRSGHDRVDHRVGAHDDVANALAVAVDQAVQRLRPREPLIWHYLSGRVVTVREDAAERRAAALGLPLLDHFGDPVLRDLRGRR